MSSSNPQQGGPGGPRQLLLSIQETCSHLACGRSYLHKLRREHRLLPVESGGRMVRYRRADIEDFAAGLPPKVRAL